MASLAFVRTSPYSPVPSQERASPNPGLGKRFLDVGAAAVLIVLLLPAMLAAALAIRLSSRGPILFRQRRVGMAGREFVMLKFRTMRVNAEAFLACDDDLRELYLTSSHKIPNDVDPRVTRVGRWLRMWSVDELPQLFNVLVGHMSLVGPRPVTRPQLGDYQEHIPDYLALRPGLTGLWQVSGRNTVTFPARAHLDADYRARCSPWLDLKILARTPAAVIFRRGSD